MNGAGDALRIRAFRRRQRADDCALVLASQGIPCAVRTEGTGFALDVVPADAERAEAALAAWERENPAWERERASRRRPSALPLWRGPIRAALLVPVGLLGFFGVTGPRDPAVRWFARGAADAARITGGEWWRTVTALTLHSDAPHVLGNAGFGALFLYGACRLFGPGLACALTLAAGAGGNALNAFAHGSAHVAVGASTAVFGTMGLLGGAGFVRARRSGRRGARALAPLAAGLGVLAMLGVNERVDIWAHCFGLAVGALLGFTAAGAAPRPPGRLVQDVLAAAALAAVLGCWALALGPPYA